jgi:hypothetical protein
MAFFLRFHKTLVYWRLQQKADVSWKVLCAKLLILCGVAKVVETRYEIFELCLQTSALSDPNCFPRTII